MTEAKSCQDAAVQMERHMQFVAKQIGGDWKWLARELKIDNCVIEGIDADIKCTGEKAYQVLIKWYQYYGKAIATKETLINALRDIGKTSIAEELAERDCQQPKHEIPESPTKSPIPESPIHTTKGFKLALSLVHNYKILQLLQEEDTILSQEYIDSNDSHENRNDDETAIKEIQMLCRKVYQQTDYKIHLIQRLMLHPNMNNNTVPNLKKGKTRPASEILQRCTSEVSLQERSKTFSSTQTLPICEEKPTKAEEAEVSTDEHQLIVRCESCGSTCLSNLQAANPDAAGSASEHEQASLPLEENCNQKSKPAPDDPEKESKTTKL